MTLDDFSRRRLREMPSIGRLRAEAQAVEWRYLQGRIVETYSRRDLDILRAAGILSIRELELIGRLDRSASEYAALGEVAQGDTSVCAHCGEDISRARKIIAVTINGAERRYHEARSGCAQAARWVTTSADRAAAKDAATPDADVRQLGRAR